MEGSILTNHEGDNMTMRHHLTFTRRVKLREVQARTVMGSSCGTGRRTDRWTLSENVVQPCLVSRVGKPSPGDTSGNGHADPQGNASRLFAAWLFVRQKWAASSSAFRGTNKPNEIDTHRRTPCDSEKR